MADLDPTLFPVNCAGSTCSVVLGRDPSAGDSQGPTALRGVVNHDDTLICDVNGLMVNRCQPPPDLDEAYLPADTTESFGNAIRKNPSCGLIVVAPLIINAGGGNAVDIPATPGDESASAKTYIYTNNDTVDQLVTLTAVARTSATKTSADAVSCLLRVALEVTTNIASIGGSSSDRELTVTLTYDDANGQDISDRRQITNYFVVPPGSTLTINHRARTIDHHNVNTDNASGNGFQITSLVARIEQVRTS